MDAAGRRALAALASRSEAETAAAMERLLTACWPGGPADGHRPAAAEWLRRWGYVPAPPSPRPSPN